MHVKIPPVHSCEIFEKNAHLSENFHNQSCEYSNELAEGRNGVAAWLYSRLATGTRGVVLVFRSSLLSSTRYNARASQHFFRVAQPTNLWKVAVCRSPWRRIIQAYAPFWRHQARAVARGHRSL